MQLTTAPDLAAKLKTSPQTITRNATRHKIGRKLGRQWVFTPSDVERLTQLLQANRQRDWAEMGKRGMQKRWQ